MIILHITECFSPSSVTFIEDRFCLFRTWSFALSKKDLDPNDISDSVSSSPLTNCCAPRSGKTRGFTVLSWFSSSSRMTCLCPREKRDWKAVASSLRANNGFHPFYHPSIHQISTLEKTKLYHRPILSSLLSACFQRIGGGGLARDLCLGRQRVSPFHHDSLTKTTDRTTGLLLQSDRLVFGTHEGESDRWWCHHSRSLQGTVARLRTPGCARL